MDSVVLNQFKHQKSKIVSSDNPLNIGVSSLIALEERVKAFRIMNRTSAQRRYVISREDLFYRNSSQVIVSNGDQIDISRVLLLRRSFSKDYRIKIYNPDEGVVVVSSMKSSSGIALGLDLLAQLININGGAYQRYIDRAESFLHLPGLLNKPNFPKLVVIGYIPASERLTEYHYLLRAKKRDPYLRVVEVCHYKFKVDPYFPRIRQIRIDSQNNLSWGHFLIEIIEEYNRPYLVENYI